MPIKTILVSLTGDDLDLPLLNAAGALTGDTSIHVTAIATELKADSIPMNFVNDGFGVYMTDDLVHILVKQNETHRAAARQTFALWARDHEVEVAERPGSASISASFVVATGDDRKILNDYAVVHDLGITPIGGNISATRHDAFDAILFGARRPVLGIPRGVMQPVFAGRPAVIAWNGGPEAIRAVTVSLPLLAVASSVSVLHTGQLGDAELARFVDFLGWHGIAATARHVGEGPTGPALLAEAQRQDAGLFVMGAYGHSRAREFVFGGVTRDILQSATMPVLLAH